MKFYTPGEKSNGFCQRCGDAVQTTFRYDSYLIPGTKTVVPRVLQAFCDTCGDIVALPHQSTYKIKEYYVDPKANKVDIRIPPVLTDILSTIGYQSVRTTQPNLLCRILAVFYLARLPAHSRKPLGKAIDFYLADSLAKGPATERLSFSVPDDSYQALEHISKTTKHSKSDVVKSIIIQAKSDILDGNNPKLTKQFYTSASALILAHNY